MSTTIALRVIVNAGVHPVDICRDLLINFKKMPAFSQAMTIRKALLKVEEEELENEILKPYANRVMRHRVLGIIEDIAVIEVPGESVFTASVKTQFADSQDVKWIPVYNYGHTVDGAILIGLGYKYLGANAKFAFFAERMLGVGGIRMTVAKMKYVLNADTNRFVLFPASINHKDIEGNWTHAGFVDLNVKEGELDAICYGKSMSLGLSSGNLDSLIITSHLRASSRLSLF